jgi:hypothetical protein
MPLAVANVATALGDSPSVPKLRLLRSVSVWIADLEAARYASKSGVAAHT